ncbi:translocation protein SEC62-like [Plodia interpunctella]|uniref:translocation protein SEC62-like n=1 Tax=Plodia interpunctella TaxID=58824 RepID=UPI0023677D90|nr:translocation protein SEC62-like [Plodia interpunctella]
MAEKRPKKRKVQFGESTKPGKPTSEEYGVAKWLKLHVPTKKTKFLKHQVAYFTGRKAVDALLTSEWATGQNAIFKTRLDVATYMHQMLLHKLFHRAKKVPVSEKELKGKSKKMNNKANKNKEDKDRKVSICQSKDTEGKEKEKKKKHKIRLEMHPDQLFLDTGDAYVWLYNPMPWYYWLYVALVILGIISVCMFPLWSARFKKGAYSLSVAAASFLAFLQALVVLRFTVFWLLWILTLSRHHLKLLPNLTEAVGLFAIFWPLYKYEYHGPVSKNKKLKKSKKSDNDAEPIQQETAQQRQQRLDVQYETKETSILASLEKRSESESENRQPDRDFEMVEPDMVEPADLHPDPKINLSFQ